MYNRIMYKDGERARLVMMEAVKKHREELAKLARKDRQRKHEADNDKAACQTG